MRATCVLMAVGNQTMLRSLKTLLEPHVEVSAMTDNVLSLIDAVEALEPDLAIVHMTILDLEHTNLTRHLNSRFPELKMIVVSDHNCSVIVCDVLNQGANGFVFQHNTKTELLPAVEEVLRGAPMYRQLKAKKESIWRIRKTDRCITADWQGRTFVSASVSKSHLDHNADFDY